MGNRVLEHYQCDSQIHLVDYLKRVDDEKDLTMKTGADLFYVDDNYNIVACEICKVRFVYDRIYYECVEMGSSQLRKFREGVDHVFPDEQSAMRYVSEQKSCRVFTPVLSKQRTFIAVLPSRPQNFMTATIGFIDNATIYHKGFCSEPVVKPFVDNREASIFYQKTLKELGGLGLRHMVVAESKVPLQVVDLVQVGECEYKVAV